MLKQKAKLFKYTSVFCFWLLLQSFHGFALGKCPTIINSAAFQVSNVNSCNGATGTISIKPSKLGGVRPYNFSLNGFTTIDSNFAGLAAGSYSLVIRDVIGCEEKTTIVIKNTAGISLVSISPIAEIPCNTSTGVIKITTISSVNSGNFQVILLETGDTINWPATQVFDSLPHGDYSLLVIDALGCKFSMHGITVPNIIITDFNCYAGDDAVIFEGESAYINGVSDGVVTWFPTDYLSDTTISNPTATPPAGVYTYTMSSETASSCTKCTDDVTITVLKEIKPPNTFTPNGDGANDVWEISRLSDYDKCEIWIYTRWGERIFHQVGYEKGMEWDGTNNGLSLPPATYYYIIDIKMKDTQNKPKKYAGAITIIK